MGYLYCDSNLNGVQDPSDKPVPSALGVFINSSGTFSNANWTTAEGFFIVALPDEPDTYTLTIHPLTLPQGTTQIAPVSHTIQITESVKSVQRIFLIQNPNCDSITPGVHYVNAANPSPAAPYLTWATAARTIQEALDIANPGSRIFVTNGVYASGGKVMHGTLLNRVALTKAIIVSSINGPQATTIVGDNGSPARCAYLADGTTLSGFTLTGGRTIPGPVYGMDEDGAGSWSDTYNSFITNCVFVNNHAHGWGGGAFRGELQNCTIVSNTAALYGGGAYESWIENCQIVGNEAELGGGVYSATAFDSVIASNTVATYASHGGGAAFSTLTRCTLLRNRAAPQEGGGGGGASHSDLIECAVEFNTSTTDGGGAYGGTAIASTLTGNSAVRGGGARDSGIESCLVATNSASQGGGVFGGSTVNSTVSRNHASSSGGGTHGASVQNSIVWANTAPNGSNYTAGTFSHSCTAPMPPAGTGNISRDPLFANSTGFQLKPTSQCLDTGDDDAVTTSTDVSQKPRIIGRAVDMGAYENQDPVSTPFLTWLGGFGLSTDGSETYTDKDDDGHSNWQEWLAGTTPTDPLSAFALLAPSRTAQGIVISWNSNAGKTYNVERASAPGGVFEPIRLNVAGQAGITSITEPAGAGYLYRVSME
jgi:hypothetical protein